MYYSITIISLIEVVLVLVPALVGIAYVTVAERKTMASMQRRLGPNAVGLENKHLPQWIRAGFKDQFLGQGQGGQTKIFFHSSCSFKANQDIINFL